MVGSVEKSSCHLQRSACWENQQLKPSNTRLKSGIRRVPTAGGFLILDSDDAPLLIIARIPILFDRNATQKLVKNQDGEKISELELEVEIHQRRICQANRHLLKHPLSSNGQIHNRKIKLAILSKKSVSNKKQLRCHHGIVGKMSNLQLKDQMEIR